MLWLYILLGFLLALFLLSLVSVKITASGGESFKCALKIGFVRITLFPPKPKKEKKNKRKKPEQKPKSDEENKTNLLKEKGLSWLIDLIKRVAKLANGVLKDFFKRIIVKKLSLSVSIAGDSAADTAVKYGYCCSAVYPAFGVIAGAVNCERYGVDIAPDFEENAKSSAAFELEAKVKIFWLAVLAIKHGYKGIKLLIDLKN